MKRAFTTIICLISTLFLVSCSCNNYQDKGLTEMNLVELNKYNEDLKDENTNLNNQLDKWKDKLSSMDEQQIIDLINRVNNEVVKYNVMITNKALHLLSYEVSSGSGTIIAERENEYYVLTNNHVVNALGIITQYYVYDYLNNEYRGELVFKDSNYDMAIIKFNKGSVDLDPITFATSNSEIGEKIITIGQPLGQRNAITFGEVIEYQVINCDTCDKNVSNIKYPCMFYDALTNNGNSGGMIVNFDFEMVGIVTYGMNNSDGSYQYGGGSPIEKIIEFLNNHEFYQGGNVNEEI